MAMSCWSNQQQDQTMTSNSRIALVTGANQGIGLQIATDLAASGLTVLLASRAVVVVVTNCGSAREHRRGAHD